MELPHATGRQVLASVTVDQLNGKDKRRKNHHIHRQGKMRFETVASSEVLQLTRGVGVDALDAAIQH